jgi:cytidylate kinase
MSNEPGPGARDRRLRIAISGKSGCGNSTVSRLVADRLGLRLINYTFKDLAREQGLSFEEICRRAEVDPQYDLTIDRMQVRLAEQGGVVLGSRLAIWLLRDTAFTVYLRAPLEVRAGRIAKRESKDPAVTLVETDERDRRDRDRYSRLYGYDIDRFGFAALVVDTASLTQEEVAEEIVAHAGGMPGAGPSRSRMP